MRQGMVLCLVLALLAGCHAGGKSPGPEVRVLLWDFQEAHEGASYVRALALLDSALVLAPAYPRLHFLRGDVLSTLYRFEEAEAAFLRALELAPRYQGAAYRLGSNAFFLGQHREALAFYRQEARLSGAGEDSAALSAVWAQIGRVYARLGAADSAGEAYEQALRHDAANDQVWMWKAELSEDAGWLSDALMQVQEAVRLAPDDPAYQYLAGALQYRTGDYEAAIGHLEFVIKAQPWHAGAHYNLGRTLLALGRSDEAARYLEATDSLQALAADIILARFAVQHAPGGRDEWTVLAMLYEQAGRYEEARQAYRIARQVAESN